MSCTLLCESSTIGGVYKSVNSGVAIERSMPIVLRPHVADFRLKRRE
jgi:hypothetical protein